ncbi:hypothetical protein K438DRAFT_194721 [Mycena galopus ATCC 62051]|nr:hypothetical protein K438DRAFT_194721 [Mycena galopus ATCC 62051]
MQQQVLAGARFPIRFRCFNSRFRPGTHVCLTYTSPDALVISYGTALCTIPPVLCSQSIDESHSALLTACQDFYTSHVICPCSLPLYSVMCFVLHRHSQRVISGASYFVAKAVMPAFNILAFSPHRPRSATRLQRHHSHRTQPHMIPTPARVVAGCAWIARTSLTGEARLSTIPQTTAPTTVHFWQAEEAARLVFPSIQLTCAMHGHYWDVSV